MAAAFDAGDIPFITIRGLVEWLDGLNGASWRSARTGSTEAARRAGMKQAAKKHPTRVAATHLDVTSRFSASTLIGLATLKRIIIILIRPNRHNLRAALLERFSRARE